MVIVSGWPGLSTLQIIEGVEFKMAEPERRVTECTGEKKAALKRGLGECYLG